MATQRPLDPRKSPWHRGDVVTLGFKKNGFVLSHTPEYLEVRWMSHDGVDAVDAIVEKIPTEDVDSVLRVMHADSIAPDGDKTCLESLEAIEALERVQLAVANR